jgi:hypothetical protein
MQLSEHAPQSVGFAVDAGGLYRCCVEFLNRLEGNLVLNLSVPDNVLMCPGCHAGIIFSEFGSWAWHPRNYIRGGLWKFSTLDLYRLRDAWLELAVVSRDDRKYADFVMTVATMLEDELAVRKVNWDRFSAPLKS